MESLRGIGYEELHPLVRSAAWVYSINYRIPSYDNCSYSGYGFFHSFERT